MSSNTCKQSKFYRPRNPEQSPFYKLVNEYFDEFERIYPEKYEKTHGFWRPIIRKTIDKAIESECSYSACKEKKSYYNS